MEHGVNYHLLWLNLLRNRLKIPDVLCIFLNSSIRGEKAHISNTDNTLSDPTVLVLELLINGALSLEIGLEIVTDKIIITIVFHRLDQ